MVRLYQEAERQLNRASYYIPLKNYEETNKALIKAQDVINALRSCLDMKIPVSKNLDSLYEYFNREIVEANVKKDKAKVDALLPMIAELREAFTEINSMSKEQMEAQEKSAQPAMQEQA